MALSERQRAVLDMERTWWQHGGSKSGTVRAQLGLSLSRYNQLLSELLSNKDAMAYDPLVVARVRRAKRDKREQMGTQPKPTGDPKWAERSAPAGKRSRPARRRRRFADELGTS